MAKKKARRPSVWTAAHPSEYIGRYKRNESLLAELKEEQRKLREDIRVSLAGHFSSLPVGEVLDAASDFYWEHPEFAGAVTRAYQDAVGPYFTPRPGHVANSCRDCGTLFGFIAPSWASAKRQELCPDCQKKLREMHETVSSSDLF